MKKLEKLRLQNLEEISLTEKKSMKGGDGWVTVDGQQYWFVGEVEVFPSDQLAQCPRCEINDELGIVFDPSYGSGGQESPSLLQSITEFLGNSVPHMLEIAGHTSGYEIDRYIITLSNGEIIEGSL